MMPKGVEHTKLNLEVIEVAKSENSDDAERR